MGLRCLFYFTGLRLGVLKEAMQDRKNWRMLVEEKTQNRERINVN